MLLPKCHALLCARARPRVKRHLVNSRLPLNGSRYRCTSAGLLTNRQLRAPSMLMITEDCYIIFTCVGQRQDRSYISCFINNVSSYHCFRPMRSSAGPDSPAKSGRFASLALFHFGEFYTIITVKFSVPHHRVRPIFGTPKSRDQL